MNQPYYHQTSYHIVETTNLNTTLLRCGINVFGMHYTCFFQQSSLLLWPGHDLLSTFFTSENLLSTFATPAMARWYPKSWTSSKAWRKLMPRNACNSELVFLVGSATSTGCVFLVLPYCVAAHALTGRLGWKQLHLCPSRDHHRRCIDRMWASNHITMHVRWCALIYCWPT